MPGLKPPWDGREDDDFDGDDEDDDGSGGGSHVSYDEDDKIRQGNVRSHSIVTINQKVLL